MTNEKRKKFLIFVAYFTVIIVILYFALKFCISYLLPFIIGAIVAVMVQKPSLTISKKLNIKQGNAALILVVLVYIILFFVVFFIGTKTYSSAAEIYRKIPDFAEKLTNSTHNIFNKLQQFLNEIFNDNGQYLSMGIKNSLLSIVENIVEYVSKFLASLLSFAPNFIFSVVVTVISGCYIAKDYENFKKIIKFAFKKEQLEVINSIRNIAVNNIFKMIKGYLLLSAITFVVLFLGFIIIVKNNALKMAAITAFVDLLPVFGSGAVLIPWAVISVVKGNFFRAAGLIAIYVTVTVIRNVLEPKIVGKQVGIPPLLALLSLFIGLKIFGIIGMLVFPLVITVVYKYAAQKVTAE